MRISGKIIICGAILALASCGTKLPTVKLLATAQYEGDGITASVNFYQLADGSLSFIKVILPDGSSITLPQAVSASGTRYTDGIQDEYWFKGEDLYISTLDEAGQWTKRNELKQKR